MTISSARQQLISNALQILGLWAFAVAQPIFSLLSDHPVFLSIRGSTSIEILIFTAIIVCFGPLALLALEAVAYYLFRRFFLLLHVTLIAILSAVILIPMIEKITVLPAFIVVIIAVFGGVVCAMLYLRSHELRKHFSWIAMVAVIFPAVFLLLKPISYMVFPANVSYNLPSTTERVRDFPPIVWIVFDELPLISLMDQEEQIDEAHYPNFSKLSKNSTWFKNATTVSYESHRSVPSILTGKRHYYQYFLPSFNNAPLNIFTLLRDVYDFEVVETLTSLYQAEAQRQADGSGSTLFNLLSVLVDVGVLYLHIVTPPEYSAKLPDISTKWGGFLQETEERGVGWKKRFAKFVKGFIESKKNRVGEFHKFVSRISPRVKPTFYFYHAAIPHRPWEYYPGGQRYDAANSAGVNNPKARWTDDEFLVRLNYQRHLLQVRFVDELLGDVMRRLKSIGMLDETLIVITADHGASFNPGDRFRGITKTNYVEILSVPLFIKTPNQTRGTVSNENVELIDIVPTVADILGIDIPWEVEGISALDPHRNKGGRKVTKTGGVFPADMDFSGPINRKLMWFGSGSDAEMYGIGIHRQFVGRKLKEFRVGSTAKLFYELAYAKFWEDVKTDGEWLPGHLTGTIYGEHGEAGQLDLAVSVNGVVSATSRTVGGENGGIKFDVMVPPSVFRSGPNELGIFVINEADDARLLRIRRRVK